MASSQPSFRRAMYLSTTTSVLVPVIGVVTAPIMAHSLGVSGRGELATATAPNSVVTIVAMLGLPEALTVLLARHPAATRRALLFSGVVSMLVGVLCLGGVWLLAPALSNGDPTLAHLVVLGTGLAVPALLVNLLRGAAMGRQMWSTVAVEKFLNPAVRLVVVAALALTGRLTVFAAVLVLTLAPIVSGLVYSKLWTRAPDEQPADPVPIVSSLMSFGTMSWIGSIASMLNGRLSQLFMTPLAGVEQLGLFVVATMIADIPLIAANAVRDVVFGVNARESDIHKVAATVRITTLIGSLGALALGAVLPWVIVPLFGSGFRDAVVPTWILLAGGVVSVPGMITGSAVGAWGRPALGSRVAVVALTSNLVALLVLAPLWGATGAAVAGLVSAVLTSIMGVDALARVAGVDRRLLVVPRASDATTAGAEVLLLVRRLSTRPRITR